MSRGVYIGDNEKNLEIGILGGEEGERKERVDEEEEEEKR